MARTQRSIEERISEKEIQYEQVMEKAKQYQAQMKRLKQQQKAEERKKRTHLLCQIGGTGGGRCDASFEFPKPAGTKWEIFYQSNGKMPGYGQ